MAPKHITVNAVAPGMVQTDMIVGIDNTDKLVRLPMNRVCQPEEVAYLVSFLCSNRADYISGQTIGINGATL